MIYDSKKAKFTSYLTIGCQRRWRIAQILGSSTVAHIKRHAYTGTSYEMQKLIDTVREHLCREGLSYQLATEVMKADGIIR